MGLTILLADNSMAAQNLGRKILTEAGYDVVTVSNGVAAGKKIAELHPDIALLDVYMAGYTGVEICEKTKAAPETAQIPVLLTVGKIEPFRAEEGIKVKADGVITKPFEANDLIAVVERLARGVHAPEPAVVSKVVVGQYDSPHTPVEGPIPAARVATPEPRGATQAAASIPAPSRQTAPKPAAVGAVRSSQPIPDAPKPAPSLSSQPTQKLSIPAAASNAAAKSNPHSPRFSPQGGEICDVCGHVNAAHAVVCQQCDVPLPSSLSLHKPGAFRLQ